MSATVFSRLIQRLIAQQKARVKDYPRRVEPEHIPTGMTEQLVNDRVDTAQRLQCNNRGYRV
jgi:hypothetical protein